MQGFGAGGSNDTKGGSNDFKGGSKGNYGSYGSDTYSCNLIYWS